MLAQGETMTLLLALLGCSVTKDWETGSHEEDPVETEDPGVNRDEDACNGNDVEPAVLLLGEDGEPCQTCPRQTFTLRATLTNPCPDEVGTIFTSDCMVGSWVVRDKDGAEAFRYDRTDCGDQQRRVDIAVGEILEDACAEHVVLQPGVYSVEAWFHDAGASVASQTVEILEEEAP